MKYIFDLAIIGAGIVGINVTYFASLFRPEWKIILLDRDSAGQGASLYSAGLDTPLGRGLWHSYLTCRGRKLYSQYHCKIKAASSNPLQSLWIVKKNQVNELKTSIVDGKLSFVRNPLQLESLKKLGVILQKDEVVFSLEGISCSNVSNMLRLILEKSLTNRNCNFCAMTNVREIIKEKNGYLKIIKEDNDPIFARRIISSTGAWNSLSTHSELNQSDFKKVSALHINLTPSLSDPLLFFYGSGYFLLPLYSKGYWLMSLPSIKEHNFPKTLPPPINETEKNAAIAFLNQHAPTFVKYIYGGRAFCDSYTNDRVPLVTPNIAAANHIDITGCSGSGYRLAPALAEIALKLCF